MPAPVTFRNWSASRCKLMRDVKVSLARGVKNSVHGLRIEVRQTCDTSFAASDKRRQSNRLRADEDVEILKFGGRRN